MNIRPVELQNLRHLIGGHITAEKKLRFCARQAPQSEIQNVKNQVSQV